MPTEITVTKDTIEKLKLLLGNFNGLKCNIDMYSQYIKNALKEKNNNN